MFMMRRLVALVLALLAGPVLAQAWPTKPVRFIVPAPPGTAPDIITRLMADKLTAIWGKQIVVDNRPGAGGNVAMSAFVKSEKDSHTFASVMATVVTLTPHLFKELQYNVDTDIVPVATIGMSPMMVAVNPQLGVNNLAEFIKLAKSRPDKINFAPPLLNTVPHLAGEMLSNAAGIKLYPIAYNGSVAAVTATMTGESQVTIDGLPPLVPLVKAGKLKAIAVTSEKRLPGYENLPTVSETYPGLVAIGWFSLLAPAGANAALVEKVNKDVNQVVQMPEIVARFADLGVYPEPGSPKAAADFIRSERVLWAKVVREAGIKPQ
jgi:tripartite-type tricarboxylate transporter receptor subunit TctC